jgi:hypothetical protein
MYVKCLRRCKGGFTSTKHGRNFYLSGIVEEVVSQLVSNRALEVGQIDRHASNLRDIINNCKWLITNGTMIEQDDLFITFGSSMAVTSIESLKMKPVPANSATFSLANADGVIPTPSAIAAPTAADLMSFKNGTVEVGIEVDITSVCFGEGGRSGTEFEPCCILLAPAVDVVGRELQVQPIILAGATILTGSK